MSTSPEDMTWEDVMKEKETRTAPFVNYILSGLDEDKAMGARLRRADNASTEFQAWEYFARFDVDLKDTCRVKAYATVSAALAQARPKRDGTFSFGRSLAAIRDQPEGDNQNNPAAVRFRRILSCRTTEEACDVLRPLLRLIAAKSSRPLCYAGLLHDLLHFGDAIRRRWAGDFYSRAPAPQDEGDTP
jgi:CRISPR system Cascade subunit CasB